MKTLTDKEMLAKRLLQFAEAILDQNGRLFQAMPDVDWMKLRDYSEIIDIALDLLDFEEDGEIRMNAHNHFYDVCENESIVGAGTVCFLQELFDEP